MLYLLTDVLIFRPEAEDDTYAKLIDQGFGPVIIRMETRYSHEVTFDESVIDLFKMAGMSPDRARECGTTYSIL